MRLGVQSVSREEQGEAALGGERGVLANHLSCLPKFPDGCGSSFRIGASLQGGSIMRLEIYNRLLAMQSSRRSVLKGGGRGCFGGRIVSTDGSPHGARHGARRLSGRASEDPRSGQGPADGCRLPEGRRDVPRSNQG